MKLNVKYSYKEPFIPPRCRKPRLREIEKNLVVSIREASSEDAPVAMVVTDYGYMNRNFGLYDTPYRWFNKRLYKPYVHESGGKSGEAYTIDEVKWYIEREGSGYPFDADEEKRITNINAAAKKFLLVDNEIHFECGEPRYYTVTFGLGHNHGGSSLSIDEHYNSNIGKQHYFNALQRKEAIEHFEKVALGRGDAKSVHETYERNIQVLIPGAVRCDPQKEHGDGCSFINSIEGIINNSNSAMEAGLMAMASAFSQTNN